MTRIREGKCPDCGEPRNHFYISDCISTVSGWDEHTQTGKHECEKPK